MAISPCLGPPFSTREMRASDYEGLWAILCKYKDNESISGKWWMEVEIKFLYYPENLIPTVKLTSKVLTNVDLFILHTTL